MTGRLKEVDWILIFKVMYFLRNMNSCAYPIRNEKLIMKNEEVIDNKKFDPRAIFIKKRILENIGPHLQSILL